MQTNRSRTSLIVFFLILVSVSGLIYWITTNSSTNEEPSRQQSYTATPPLNIQGLSFSDYLGAQLTSRIRVKQLYVRPRKFGGFRIKSVNELFLDEAKFEFHQVTTHTEPGSPTEGPTLGNGLASAVRGLAELRGIGRVVQGNVQDMTLEIFRDDKLHLSVVSKSAILDFKKRQTQMKQARLLAPGKNLTLVSNLIVWDDKRELFLVPGRYELKTANGKKSGEDIALTLDLQIRRIRTK